MKKNLLSILLFCYVLIAIFIIYYFDGTGDAGDSILHYLYAKYAFQHPELFFNHWAKPFFVLLASPFAQLGMLGMKIFNVLAMLLTLLFTFKTAKELRLKKAYLSVVVIVFSPLLLILTFSGLTEPLFASIIAISLFGFLKKKYLTASLLLSFLPFVRSVGLIIIAVFGLYLLLKKKWKYLPLLLFGHVFYSVVGYWVYNDLFWVFTKIPYSKLSSIYGSGNLFHFIEQLLYVVGVPIYVLFWIGFIVIIWNIIKKKINLDIQVLIFLGFLTFFSAHTLFWYFGIFNSMGLKRVLVGVIPFVSIISLIGFNFISEYLEGYKKVKYFFQVSLISYVLVFPFTDNPSAIDWNHNLNLSIEQKKAKKIATIINNSIQHKRLIYSHPYLSEAFNIDHFDKTKHINLNQNYNSEIQKEDLIIWDYWFSVVEEGVSKEVLDFNPKLTAILTVKDEEQNILYSIYKVNN